MSVEAMSWALNQQLIDDPGARFVLVGLANHADAEGCHAFPSLETLARYSGMSTRNVRRKIRMLEEAGLIEPGNEAIVAAHITRMDRRPQIYNMKMTPADSDQQQDNGATDCHPADLNGGTGCPPVDGNGGTGCPVVEGHGRTNETQRADTGVRRTIHNHPKENNTREKPEKFDPQNALLPECVKRSDWIDFCKHRSEIKKPLSATAVDRLLAKLVKLDGEGHDTGEMIDHAISSGYQGVFPVTKFPQRKPGGAGDPYTVGDLA